MTVAEFRNRVLEAATLRWLVLTDEIRSRLDYEIGVIAYMGHVELFRLASDVARAAREAGGVQGPGRGADVASAVAYALGITNLDPLAYVGLMFERYLCPGFGLSAIVMMEFDSVGEEAAVAYLKAHSPKVGKLRRRYRAPQSYETEAGELGITHLLALDIVAEVRRLRAACGREFIELSEVPRDDAETLGGFSAGETRDVAGFDSPNMRQRLRGLKQVNFGILVDLYTLAFPGHELHREWYLARQNGEAKIPDMHPMMARCLLPTKGVLLYQEQIMLIARRLASFTRCEARRLYKAAGKLLLDSLQKMEPKFIAGCLANAEFREGDYEDEAQARAAVQEIWNTITRDGRYATSRAHSMAFARMAYELMHLKVHCPAEWSFAVAKVAERRRRIEPIRRIGGEIELNELRYGLENGCEVTLLMRHAERPPLDPSDTSFGETLPLTGHGREEARLLGREIAEIVDPASVKFVASGTFRTIETATEMAKCLGSGGVVVDDVLGGDTPYFGSLEDRLKLIGEGHYREALNDYFAKGEQRGYRSLGPATEIMERRLFDLHGGETGLVIAVTHDVNVACFLAGRGIVTSFTEETWPHYLDAVVIVRDRNHDFIEYGWLRHFDCKPLPTLVIE